METMTVYIDILFLTNFCIDYLIVSISSLILNKKVAWWKMLTASAVGGISSITAYTAIPPILITAVIIAYPAITVLLIYGKQTRKSIKSYIKSVLTIYAVSISFGGGFFALYYFTKLSEYITVYYGITYINLPTGIFIAFAVFTYILLHIVFIFRRKNLSKTIYNIKARFDKKTIDFNALLDTGNLLKEPESKLPVILADSKSKSFSKHLEKNENAVFLGKNPIYVQVRGFNGQTQLIPCYRPDKITVDINKSKIIVEALIGLNDNRISKDGAYEAIIGSLSDE